MSQPVQPERAARSRVLRAVSERILPGVVGPGAARVDAAAAIELALDQPCNRGLRPALDGLLDGLQARAQERHARDFVDCSGPEQDELLRALDHEPEPWSRMLFRYLIEATVEGMLGDPVHGGNRDFLGWEFVGLRAEDVRSGLCRGTGAA